MRSHTLGRRTVTLAAACLLMGVSVPGCATSAGGPEGRRSSATVLTGTQLVDAGPTLLEALASRVMNLSVNRREGRCPALILRGEKTVHGRRGATVYLDGTRLGDTCILSQISTRDVERVEVYPSGSAADPRYVADASGLIVIFRVGY
jgi:hypothetical protein